MNIYIGLLVFLLGVVSCDGKMEDNKSKVLSGDLVATKDSVIEILHVMDTIKDSIVETEPDAKHLFSVKLGYIHDLVKAHKTEYEMPSIEKLKYYPLFIENCPVGEI